MSSATKNSFNTHAKLKAAGKEFNYHSLPALEKAGFKNVARLPYSLKVLLENLLRLEDGVEVTKSDIEAVATWDAKAKPSKEIRFMPARILLQDFTGVPAVCDLAAMRDAIKKMGGDPSRVNPLSPADLVIDHSVQVDFFGNPEAYRKNSELDYERNIERYEFLRWGQSAFKNFRVVPPNTGIVHQVNVEYLAQVAFTSGDWVYPDTLVGTDSHTTMINGLGVLGWGVGGIEAEAAMLGQPIAMLIPQVVGFKLTGEMPAGTTATDLVLMVTQMLRQKGVVGKFVEFYGPGLASLSLADRATIANMAPEYGATCGLFPVDEKTTEFLRLTNRAADADRVEAYYKATGMWFSANDPEPMYSDTLSLDLAKVVPSLAGPSRPQDRVPLTEVSSAFREALPTLLPKGADAANLDKAVPVNDPTGEKYELKNGSIVIAAITSCTNTSNPANLLTAGLLARNAVKKGLSVKPWVKTSLAPGSQVVTKYYEAAGLLKDLEKLKFNVVGYGCTTCIGNSGPLPPHIADATINGKLTVASVLSGNRNFEGRINPHVRANYLASPPLVVAYALVGDINVDIAKDPIGTGSDGKPVYLRDIWPSQQEINDTVSKFVTARLFEDGYQDVFTGDERWRAIEFPKSDIYKWDDKSTYIKQPPLFQGFSKDLPPGQEIRKARVLALLGDSVTTDHISPAGSIQPSSPAGQYLQSLGVAPKDFNSYGARRGNHEVMIRGTFANVRIKNRLLDGVEGGYTKHFPDGKQTSIYEAAMQYQADGVPTVVLAGKEYGTGSSRDWAAKGTQLLGVKAVIAESFERIHRSNLIGMGVLPLQFVDGQNYESLGLTGTETFDIEGLNEMEAGAELTVRATREDGSTKEFSAVSRIDTPRELEYYRHGGILPYVLRQAL